MLDPDRLAALRMAKLRALVSPRWDISSDAETSKFPDGASLTDEPSATTWVLMEDDPVHRLGAALAVAFRAGSRTLHVITEADAPVLARRAALVEFDISVWSVDGTELEAAVAAPPAVDPAPSEGALSKRSLLEEAGLEVVVEGGSVTGELNGLEACRVVDSADAGVRVEAGVGRFDREAGMMVRAGMPDDEALQVVVELIAPLRRAGADRHPMNQLVKERWLRSVLVQHPEMVGAAELRAVGSAVPRTNLTEDGVATALGTDAAGDPIVVTASVGVFLDLVPSALDDRLTHSPDAKLVLVVPERDDAPITRELAGFAPNTEVMTVASNWAEPSFDRR